MPTAVPLIFYASLFKAMGRGRVIGVDIEIRPQNRRAIETHELSWYITLIEGSSVDPAVVEDVRGRIRPDERVMVVLDSDHSKRHVLAELEAYHGLVSDGSYIVATDGAMITSVTSRGAGPSGWSTTLKPRRGTSPPRTPNSSLPHPGGRSTKANCHKL